MVVILTTADQCGQNPVYQVVTALQVGDGVLVVSSCKPVYVRCDCYYSVSNTVFLFSSQNIAAAFLFLACKVEEQPRKLEHVVTVAYGCLHKGEPMIESSSEVCVRSLCIRPKIERKYILSSCLRYSNRIVTTCPNRAVTHN